MISTIFDYINKVIRGEKIRVAGKISQWKKVKELQPGMKIAVVEHPRESAINQRESASMFFDEIVSIKKVGLERVYDIEVEGTHNFVGGHFVKKNDQLSSTLPADATHQALQAGNDQSSTNDQISKQFENCKLKIKEEYFFGGIIAHNTYISGSVGIGATSPRQALDVAGGNIIAEKFFDNSSYDAAAGTAPYFLDPASSVTSLTVAGNVGIGTTSPTSQLQVIGGEQQSLGKVFFHQNAATNYPTLLVRQTGSGGDGGNQGLLVQTQGNAAGNIADFAEWNGTTSTSRMVIKQTGLVGIGTTGPRAPLDVTGSILQSWASNFLGTQYTTGSYQLGLNTDATNRILYVDNKDSDAPPADPNGSIQFRTGSTPTSRMTITYGGNVGIGTTGPGRTLDVVGNWGGNVVVDNRTLTTTQTVTESTKALAYHLTNSPASESTVTITFNITGLPDTDGTFAYIYTQAIYNPVEAGSSTVAIQINGTQVSTVTTTSGTVNEMYTIIRTNSTWHLAGGTSAANTADLAEWMLYKGVKPQPGQIVSISDTENTVEVSPSSYNPKAIGIVSTKPHTIMGQQTDNSVAVALAGQVPIIVSSTNGIIHNGDSLTTSSFSGIGMKAVQSGQIIGKALETTASWNQQTCLPAQSIDSIIWPNDDGTNPSKPCFSLPDGTFVGKIMVFVNLSWYGDPPVYLTSTGDIQILGANYNGLLDEDQIRSASGRTQIRNSAGETIQRIGAFAEIVAGKVKTGLVDTTNLITDNLVAGTIRVNQLFISDNLRADKIISPIVETNELKIQSEKLKVTNKDNKTLMEINNQGQTTHFGDLLVQGNATVSGTISANQLEISGNLRATTLKADDIKAKTGRFSEILADKIRVDLIEGLNDKIASIAGQLNNNSINQLPNNSITSYPEATNSALLSLITNHQSPITYIDISSLDTSTLMVRDLLSVIGTAIMTNLKVTNNMVIDNNLVLTSNSISTLGCPTMSTPGVDNCSNTLYLQPSGFGAINMLAGKFTVDDKGNVAISGNLDVAGTITTKDLKVKDSLFANMLRPIGDDLSIQLSNNATTSGQIKNSLQKGGQAKLKIKNSLGNEVASVDASGSATFKKLNIATAEATSSSTGFNQLINPEVSTNATAGKAILIANTEELVINNQNITKDSLIYITPTSDTQNKVLYIKNKAIGAPPAGGSYFTVGIDQAINKDIEFNWWIIN